MFVRPLCPWLLVAVAAVACGRPAERESASDDAEYENPNAGGRGGSVAPSGGRGGNAPSGDAGAMDSRRDAAPTPAADANARDASVAADAQAAGGMAGGPAPGQAGPAEGPLASEALPTAESFRKQCKAIVDVSPGDLAPALKAAMPGDCLVLAPGVYDEGTFVTGRDGTPAAPIVVLGPRTAILRGSSRLFQVQHSHVWLHGFTIDGGAKSCSSSGANTLVYIQSLRAGIGLTGVRVLGLALKNARGECVRLKYLAHGNEIGWNEITACGREDFGPEGQICDFEGTPCYDDATPQACRERSASKNGEGIYVGTAPEQSYCPPEIDASCSLKNPTKEPDKTYDNRIHHNVIDTRGNECVDIKENATGNIVEYNRCTGQGDPNSAGLDARGDGNVFRWNDTSGNVGAGVRLGGDRDRDGKPLFGFANEVYANIIRANKLGGIKFEAGDQKRICGNRMAENGGGNRVGNQAAGYYKLYTPEAPCE